MQHVITSFFGWPDGSLWGNLLAEVICALPIWAIAMWRFEKRHKRHQAQIHNQITQEFANLKSNQ